MADRIQTRAVVDSKRSQVTSGAPGAARRSSAAEESSAKQVNPTKMTERERLQASLRQTLTEF